MTMIDDETLRRMATSVMMDMVCMHSPAQAALRDEGRCYDALFEAFLLARDDAIESQRLSEELAESCERLLRLIDLVADQIGAPNEQAR
jgi:arginine deiminase